MAVKMASVHSRILAYLIDTLIKAIYQTFTILLLVCLNIDFRKNQVIIQYFINVVFPFFVTFYYVSNFNATLGQQLFKIKIENDNIFLEKPTIEQHLIRILVYDVLLAHIEYITFHSCFVAKCIPEFLQLMFLIKLANDPKNKGFHDYLANTIVTNYID